MISLVVLALSELRQIVRGEIADRVAALKADGDHFFRESKYEVNEMILHNPTYHFCKLKRKISAANELTYDTQ